MTTSGRISRRTFLKGAALAAAAVPLSSLLTACGTSSQEETSAQSYSASASASTSSAASSSSASASAAASNGAILVAYFSATGNTKRAAEAIAQALGADTFEIAPSKPYSSDDLDYNDDSSRVVREHEDEDQQDIELETVTPDGFDSYQTIFFGYPTWWQEAAWPVRRFATGNSFEGKTVVPFTTSTSSPLGDSAKNLAKLAGTGTWQDGMRLSSSFEDSEAESWAKGLNI